MELRVLNILLALFMHKAAIDASVSTSKQLYDHLFSPDRYSPVLLPDCGSYSGVNVSFNLALRQVIDLDEKAQMLSVNVWIRMTWIDCNLMWNRSDYSGLDSLLVSYGDVWTPDLANYDSLAEEEMMPGYDRYKARVEHDGHVTYLYPTVLRTICRVKVTDVHVNVTLAEEEMMPGYDRYKARVEHDGHVTYLYPTVLRTICRVKVTYFPFDVQTCTLTLAEEEMMPGYDRYKARVEHDGHVTYLYPTVLRTTCRVKVTYFPFDVQTCTLTLAEEEMMPGYDRYKARVEHDGRVTYLYPTVLRTICRVKVTYFPFDVQTCTLTLAEEEMMPGYDRYKARVEHDGRVTYLYPTVLRTICRVKVTYFPFDVQTCTLTFGSWSHVISEIDFFPGLGNGLPGKGGKVFTVPLGFTCVRAVCFTRLVYTQAKDAENYLENNEWTKLSFSSTFENSTFPLGNYRVMSFDIRVQRRPAFYLLIFVFPCIFLNLIAILGCFIPAESGEKASLEVTILLSLAVFLLVMSELLPPDSDNYPLLGLFFACSMSLVGLRLIVCIFIVKIHHGGSTGKSVSDWTRRCILGRLGNVFCDKSSDTESSISSDRTDKYEFEEFPYKERPKDKEPKESFKMPDNGKLKDTKGQILHEHQIYMQRRQNANINNIRNGGARLHRTSSHQPSVYYECMQKIVDRIDASEADSRREAEWMRLARIVDRISIVIYLIAYITILIVFLVQMTESLQCLDGECP